MPCVVPRSTSASIATSAGSETFFLPATSLIAERKHADQPAANSCSGLAPAPGPPGDESLTSSRPSSLWEAPPSRPPVVCAFAVYRIFSRVTIRSLSRGWRTLRVHLDARRCAGYELSEALQQKEARPVRTSLCCRPAMARRGDRLRWQSYNPLIRCRLPGPQLPTQTDSCPVTCASAPAANAAVSSWRTAIHSMDWRPRIESVIPSCQLLHASEPPSHCQRVP